MVSRLLDFEDLSSVDDATKGIVKSAMLALKHNNYSNQYVCNKKKTKNCLFPTLSYKSHQEMYIKHV
jgi:hypothetical protein